MKVTVVTIAFNAAPTIVGAVESVLGQQGVDLDYVVIDGGSTDRTADLLAPYRDRFAHFVSEPDGGLYHALNKGLAAARGDVIGFLHADDMFAGPDVLARLTAPLAGGALDAVYADIEFVDETLRPVRFYSGRRFHPTLLPAGRMPPHPSFYCRTALLRDVGGFDTRYRSAADFDMMVKLFGQRRISAAYLPETVVRMRVGGTSTQGWRSYQRTSLEMIAALQANGIAPDTMAIWLRAFVKAPEVLRGRMRRLFGR